MARMNGSQASHVDSHGLHASLVCILYTLATMRHYWFLFVFDIVNAETLIFNNIILRGRAGYQIIDNQRGA